MGAQKYTYAGCTVSQKRRSLFELSAVLYVYLSEVAVTREKLFSISLNSQDIRFTVLRSEIHTYIPEHHDFSS